MNVVRLTQKLIKPTITFGNLSLVIYSYGNLFYKKLIQKSLIRIPFNNKRLTSQIIYMNSNENKNTN